MHPRDATWLVGYAAQLDPRVQQNQATAELWATGLGSMHPDTVREAIARHYNLNDTVVTLAGIKAAARAHADTVTARERALERPAPSQARIAHVLRKRDPERWDYLRSEGRRAACLEQARTRAKLEGLDRSLAEDHAHAWADHVEDELAAGRTVTTFMPWPPTRKD